MLDPVGRRSFLKLMGASLALAGVSACTRQPTEKIFPYVKAPELIVPGEPLYFATAMPLGGIATGLLVESHMGRPTKIEGNPDHPASLGATDLLGAGVGADALRSRPLAGASATSATIQTWSNFSAALAALLAAQKAQAAAPGCASSPARSPRRRWRRRSRQLLAQYPQATLAPVRAGRRATPRAPRRAAPSARPLDTQYRFDRADRVLSLDADFLGGSGPGQVRYVRDFIAPPRRGARRR